MAVKPSNWIQIVCSIGRDPADFHVSLRSKDRICARCLRFAITSGATCPASNSPFALPNRILEKRHEAARASIYTPNPAAPWYQVQ